MTRDQAFKRAVELWGDGAIVGETINAPHDKFTVGKKVYGEYEIKGTGDTWEDAFKNVKQINNVQRR